MKIKCEMKHNSSTKIYKTLKPSSPDSSTFQFSFLRFFHHRFLEPVRPLQLDHRSALIAKHQPRFTFFRAFQLLLFARVSHFVVHAASVRGLDHGVWRHKARRDDDQQELEAAEACEERVSPVMPGRRKGSSGVYGWEDGQNGNADPEQGIVKVSLDAVAPSELFVEPHASVHRAPAQAAVAEQGERYYDVTAGPRGVQQVRDLRKVKYHLLPRYDVNNFEHNAEGEHDDV